MTPPHVLQPWSRKRPPTVPEELARQMGAPYACIVVGYLDTWCGEFNRHSSSVGDTYHRDSSVDDVYPVVAITVL